MLVYENYAKFISATDTIRRMKGNVEVRWCFLHKNHENTAIFFKRNKL